ncbi:MAG: Rad52/Rad22 family DNA repair protein [Nostoc sp.]|uniref:Rad52/Rad22 family DNA repair protein n=1 Tax=Nostoc sp. TaxID=1180 RepID=UPI002FFA6062
MQLEEILPKLQDWFAPEEHKDRTLRGGGRWFYVPHQSITQRLNAVCPGHWHTKVNSTNIAGDYTVVMVELTICGVTRTGIGDDKTFPEVNDQGKAKIIGTPPVRAFRSAFKDAAEQFGICAYLDDQKDKRNEFAKYMTKKGDGRATQFITDNGWIEQPKEPQPLGRDSLMKSIKSQLDRLKWTTTNESEYLIKAFKVKSRTELSNNQLSTMMGYLQSQESSTKSLKLSVPTMKSADLSHPRGDSLSVSDAGASLDVKVAILPSAPLDRNLLNAEIESLLKRKNISVEQAQGALFELFKVRSRQHLSDNQLAQFLDYLKSPKSIAI